MNERVTERCRGGERESHTFTWGAVSRRNSSRSSPANAPACSSSTTCQSQDHHGGGTPTTTTINTPSSSGTITIITAQLSSSTTTIFIIFFFSSNLPHHHHHHHHHHHSSHKNNRALANTQHLPLVFWCKTWRAYVSGTSLCFSPYPSKSAVVPWTNSQAPLWSPVPIFPDGRVLINSDEMDKE